MEKIYERIKKEIRNWMMSEYDDRVKDYWKLSHGNYIVKLVDDKVLEDVVKKLKTVPLHLGSFVLSFGKRILNKFIHLNIGFLTKDVYYTDTDSLYIKNKQ